MIDVGDMGKRRKNLDGFILAVRPVDCDHLERFRKDEEGQVVRHKQGVLEMLCLKLFRKQLHI